MKKFIIVVAAFFAGLSTFAQSNDGGNRMVVHQKNGEIKAFACSNVDSINFVKTGDLSAEVMVKEVHGREVTLTVTMPEGCKGCDFAFIEKSLEDTSSDVYEYVRNNKVAEISESGDVTIKELIPGTEYIFYTVSKDVYGLESGFVRTEVKTAIGEEDFALNITELTSGHVNLDILPKDKQMKYTYTLLTKKKYDESVEYNGDIFLYDVAWWEFLAESYGESDWRNIMNKLLTAGDYKFESIKEYGFLDWDTDHIFYVYGIDPKGDATTQLYTKEFKSPKPVASDNEISVEILEVLPNGCNVRVTTTNDDEYVVMAQKQSFIDYWEQEGTETDMLKVLYSDCDLFQEWCGYKHSGSEEFFVKSQKANTDYVLIVFGTNEGPSTEVQYIKFKTAANQ